jgi:hypothetical protein
MAVLIPLGFLLSIWIGVIWGSIYFNQNVKS